MIRPLLAVAAVAIVLTTTGCMNRNADITVATPPPSVDLGAVPEQGGTGTGLQFLDGTSAVAEVALAARSAEWFSVEVRFQQRYTPTEEVPSITLHNYTATAEGTSSEFNAQLEVDGDPVQLYLRDGVLLGYGDPAVLAGLGFATPENGPACLAADQDVARPLIALVVPDRMIQSLLSNPDNPVALVHTGRITEVEDSASVLEFGVTAGNGVIGTMWVSAVGQPYPQRLVIADATGDFLAEFSAWGDDGTLDEPDDSPSDC